MITKRFGTDFNFDSKGHSALTLESSYLTDEQVSGHYTKTYDDGWTISAYVYEDYWCWINEFEATHPRYGKVWGDFEKEVYADTEEGYSDFYNHFPPESWDYGDI